MDNTTAKRKFLITGGSQGIGRAIVEAALAEGHDVLFTGVDAERLRETAKQTGAHGFVADVSDPAANEATVAACLEKMGGIDVLINNAGFGAGMAIGEIDMDAMRSVFDVNVFGLVDLTNRVVPLLQKAGGGDIVNIASTSGLKGHKNGTAYSGSKWALRGISQCWQAELRPHNIRVVCLCPSEVQTGFGGRHGRNNPNKLYATDIAAVVLGTLRTERRVLLTEIPIIATNPWAED